jgi:hypothetical protein
MTPCRSCGRDVSEEAFTCPGCGAPYPARVKWDGWGFEYRSRAELLGLPLVHVAFKYRPHRLPVVARGWLAVGQFACGVVTISQFGLGLVAVGQVAVGAWVLAQLGLAWRLVAQLGVYLDTGRGQLVWKLGQLLSGA